MVPIAGQSRQWTYLDSLLDDAFRGKNKQDRFKGQQSTDHPRGLGGVWGQKVDAKERLRFCVCVCVVVGVGLSVDEEEGEVVVGRCCEARHTVGETEAHGACRPTG